MGPDEIHPGVLRELADENLIILEKSRQSYEVTNDWEKGNITPIFEK